MVGEAIVLAAVVKTSRVLLWTALEVKSHQNFSYPSNGIYIGTLHLHRYGFGGCLIFLCQ